MDRSPPEINVSIACLLFRSTVLAMFVLIVLEPDSFRQGVRRWEIHAGGGTFIGTSPTMAPDGSSVVYASPATGHGDLYRYDRKTGKNVRLTSYPEYDGYPLLSPDGKTVYFEREKEGVGHVWAIDPDGTHQRQLTDGQTDDNSPSFTTDGKLVLFCRESGGIGHLWLMDADGGHQKQITDGSWFDGRPLFSPDGKRIVFSRQEQVRPRFTPVSGTSTLRFSEIFVMNADGTDQHRITHNLYADLPISFSPDGKRVFYFRDETQGRFLGASVMDADGSNSRDLGQGYTPALSFDCRRILLLLPTGGLALMNSDGTGSRLIHPSKRYLSDPTFSRDGSLVVFAEWPDDPPDAARIKILDIASSKIETAPPID
jgi:TolB protein